MPVQQSLPLSDQTNAETMVEWYGEDSRYCYGLSKWFFWDGKRWAPDETGEVMRRAKQTIKRLAAQVEAIGDDERAKAWLAHIKKSLSANRLQAMVILAQSEEGIPLLPTQLDANPWLLNCLNGTIDLRTAELCPHRRDNLITRLAPVIYEPDARSELWERFLERILPDENLRGFVQRAIGYSLTGDASEEKLFFAFGPTATGKSTLLSAVTSTVGDYAITADFETFLAREWITGGPRSDLARLAGHRFVVSLEVEDGKQLAEALIKQLTGGDAVAARFLYRETFQFVPTFKLWLAANHRPLVRDDDDAMWRRILQIPFNEQIPEEERDPRVKAQLRSLDEAGSAILAWAVQGCLAWQQEGLGIPPVVKETTQAYREQMDPIKDFIEERCTISPQAHVTKGELWAAYQRWGRASGARLLGNRQFRERLQRRGFDEGRNGKSRFWIGIGLLNDTCDTSDKKSENF